MVEEGAREAAETGVIEGYAFQDLEVVVTGITWRDGESKPFAYKIAAADAVRSALAKAKPVLLQPFVVLGVLVPSEQLGEVIASLDQRQGTILDVSERGSAVKVVECTAPLKQMFGYATDLRSRTQGRAVFTLRFDRYDVA
jgi:elongation factor G